ncbi:MAG: FliG C-terminal domain-containing protein [Paracoccaceae bacterium]
MAQLLPPATQRASPPVLSRKAKAAIVVRLLLNEGAEIPLEELPDALQAQLTQQMGAMRMVDRDTLASVVDEFSEELSQIGLSFPHGMAGALEALDGKISPQTAVRLRKEAGVRQAGDPWKRIRAQNAEALLPLLENESVEVAAVMLAKLDIPKAAELLGMLPGQKARSITYAVSLTGAVTPDAVDRIGLSLASQLDDKPVMAFALDPVERVGEILNSSMAATRDDVLSGLDETDADFASLVRRAIFTFLNIPDRIEPRDIPKVLREIDQAQVVIALAAAKADGMEEAAEFILSNLSGRMSDSIREEMEEAGTIKPRIGEAAMAEFIGAIRKLEASGDITLVVPEGEDD